ncbi:hypothetical protein SXCC_00393 [Gluconacetobacter sp. SXCC-1]|nr:hypothetical protein SXCC_00393 [Gluconacetobacter sp. SXCC-1]
MPRRIVVFISHQRITLHIYLQNSNMDHDHSLWGRKKQQVLFNEKSCVTIT